MDHARKTCGVDDLWRSLNWQHPLQLWHALLVLNSSFKSKRFLLSVQLKMHGVDLMACMLVIVVNIIGVSLFNWTMIVFKDGLIWVRDSCKNVPVLFYCLDLKEEFNTSNACHSCNGCCQFNDLQRSSTPHVFRAWSTTITSMQAIKSTPCIFNCTLNKKPFVLMMYRCYTYHLIKNVIIVIDIIIH
jgi:hypothetical protein